MMLCGKWRSGFKCKVCGARYVRQKMLLGGPCPDCGAWEVRNRRTVMVRRVLRVQLWPPRAAVRVVSSEDWARAQGIPT